VATREKRGAAATALPQPEIVLFIVVLVLSGFRAWGQSAMTTFLPKFLHDQNITATVYGFVVALFMGGSAIGGVVGGILGDRWGRIRTITLSFALSITPFYFLPLASGAWLYVLAGLAGFLNGGPHSVLVTMAQRALPGRGSLASGISLGFMFTAGALGTYFSGLVADRIGLAHTLQLNALIAATTTLLSLLLILQRKPARIVIATGD
jgi:FSR family fosmidomycin resistance protein-like MFS transporter